MYLYNYITLLDPLLYVYMSPVYLLLSSCAMCTGHFQCFRSYRVKTLTGSKILHLSIGYGL